MPKKVFVSYDYTEDRHYKNLMKAWSKDKRFDFTFKDKSLDVSIKSHNKTYIKQCISRHIKESDILVCIIGDKTHSSEYVNWEIQEAHKLKKRIVGIKLEPNNKLPENLTKYVDSVCKEFNLDNIANILKGLKNEFSSGVGINLKKIKCGK